MLRCNEITFMNVISWFDKVLKKKKIMVQKIASYITIQFKIK